MSRAPETAPTPNKSGRPKIEPAIRLQNQPDFYTSRGGTPLPNERLLSGRIDYDSDDARKAAGQPAFFLRPLRQAPRLDPSSPQRRTRRTLAPLERGQGEAE